MSDGQPGTSARRVRWWCVGRCGWSQRWRRRWERGRQRTCARTTSRRGAGCASSWKRGMRLAEQPVASVVTPQSTSPGLKTSYFTQGCHCSEKSIVANLDGVSKYMPPESIWSQHGAHDRRPKSGEIGRSSGSRAVHDPTRSAAHSDSIKVCHHRTETIVANLSEEAGFKVEQGSSQGFS